MSGTGHILFQNFKRAGEYNSNIVDFASGKKDIFITFIVFLIGIHTRKKRFELLWCDCFKQRALPNDFIVFFHSRFLHYNLVVFNQKNVAMATKKLHLLYYTQLQKQSKRFAEIKRQAQMAKGNESKIR